MPRTNAVESLKAMRAEMVEQRAEKLMGALAAACAVIAHADGRAVSVEIRRMLAVMRADPLLSVLPAEDALVPFIEYARVFRADPQRARTVALRQVGRLAEEPRQARLVLHACLTVSEADGVVHPAEAAAIREVRLALGLDPDRGAVPALPPPRPRGPFTAPAKAVPGIRAWDAELPATVMAPSPLARPALALAG